MPEFEQPISHEHESLTPKQPELSDGHYYAKLIMREGTNTYFCPRCGNLQHSAHMCMHCDNNHPQEVMPLNANTFAPYASLIRETNPL